MTIWTEVAGKRETLLELKSSYPNSMEEQKIERIVKYNRSSNRALLTENGGFNRFG
ncbi:TPA: hypothetical protein ROX88_000752 [Bacillus pseudomycoides]|nr:hypothetical protein [Bacillus pseudomycoides]